MKICLISSPTVTEFDNSEVAGSETARLSAEHAPMGVLTLAAVLEQQGIIAEIIDLNRLYYDYLRSAEYDPNDFCSFVVQLFESQQFDVFGFSTICSTYPLTLRIAEGIKATHPESIIILGGPQASVVDVETLRTFPFIDFVVRGEADETLPRLLEKIASGRSSAFIQGITFRAGEGVVRNQNAPVIHDLDSLPMPAFHRYGHMEGCKYVPLEHGRGCPFACSFCSTNDFFRRQFRLKSPQRVIEQMKFINATYGVSSFELIHDMFTVDRKRVVAFCEALTKSGEQFSWSCSARTDCIDDELIAIMANSGCQGIFFGIDSGSDRTQRFMNKHLNLSEAMARIKCTTKHRVSTTVSMIVGFPEETKDDLRATVGFLAEALRFEKAEPQFHMLGPLAETPITSEYKDRLTLDGVFSDVSHQGWRQDPADWELIKSYPQIFPNFYAIPTRWLDRKYLREVREFVLRGALTFRWLMVGLHHDSGDLLNVFDEWKAWCLRRQTNDAPPDEHPREYYGSNKFQPDFLDFVRFEYVPRMARVPAAVLALTECEAIINALDSRCETSSKRRPRSPSLSIDSVLRLNPGVRLTKIGVDYRKLIACLKTKSDLGKLPHGVAYLAIRKSGNRVKILQLSALSNQLLQMCDGTLTVKKIIQRFSQGKKEIEGIAADKAGLFGLELLRQQGLIAASGPSLSPNRSKSSKPRERPAYV